MIMNAKTIDEKYYNAIEKSRFSFLEIAKEIKREIEKEKDKNFIDKNAKKIEKLQNIQFECEKSARDINDRMKELLVEINTK